MVEFTKHSLERAKQRFSRKNSTKKRNFNRLRNKLKEIVFEDVDSKGVKFCYTYPNPSGYSLCYVMKNQRVITVYRVKLNKEIEWINYKNKVKSSKSK